MSASSSSSANGERVQLTGLVLAGGQGSRMGGRDKGLVEYCGRPLVDHVLERISPQVEELLISANRSLEEYARRGCRIVVDDFTGFQGPLAGVLAGLRAASHEWVLTVPCDMPHLPCDLARRLLAARHTHLIVVAVAGTRSHPAVMLIHQSLADQLAAYLQSGKRSVHGFQESTGFVTVDFAAADMQNINSPDEL